MSHLTWSSELDTGISEIDQQHKQIMVLINRLQDARDSGDREGILAVVNDLVDYTVSHLDFEESMLEKVQYEFLGGHKKVHTLLVRNVKGIQQRIQAGEDVVHELHSLLHRWLFNHICGGGVHLALPITKGKSPRCRMETGFRGFYGVVLFGAGF